MTPERLAAVLGEPPVPRGTWRREATYVSAAALRGGGDVLARAEELAGRLRDLPGVGVSVGDDGMLTIIDAVPGEIAGTDPPPVPFADPWPDLPRTWENPGFVVRYGHARAAAVRRWARDLGVPLDGFAPEALDHPLDRAVLRVLAELPGRRVSRDPGWAAYLTRLAVVYHDAHEGAPAVPVGDTPAGPVHAARVALAGAVRKVLPGPDRL